MSEKLPPIDLLALVSERQINESFAEIEAAKPGEISLDQFRNAVDLVASKAAAKNLAVILAKRGILGEFGPDFFDKLKEPCEEIITTESTEQLIATDQSVQIEGF